VIYLRNLDARRTIAIPVAPGCYRLLRPAVTSAVPKHVLQLRGVQKLLARHRIVRIGSAGWDAEERQQRSQRVGMANLVRLAEQAAFDLLRQPLRIRRRRKSSGPYKRRADMWPSEWTEQLRQRWMAGATGPDIAAGLGVTPGAVSAKARREGLKPRYQRRSHHNGQTEPVHRCPQTPTRRAHR
jgi:hypothetical protein